MKDTISGLEIIVSSNLDYEKMVIYICSSNNDILILSCDEGLKKTKIDILDKFESRIIRSFYFYPFIEALFFSFESLKIINGIPEPRPTSIIQAAIEDAISINDQAQFQIDDILTNPKTEIIKEESGNVQFYAPDGRGAYFSADNSFIGFLSEIEFTNGTDRLKEFKVIESSDLDYELMVTYLMFLNSRVVVLNCDDGIENTTIEIFSIDKNEILWRLDYRIFMETLQMAFAKLKEANTTLPDT